jgi:hypothetical protein
MNQPTFWDNVRYFIGAIAWKVFLWSIRMSEDQYLSGPFVDEESDE